MGVTFLFQIFSAGKSFRAKPASSCLTSQWNCCRRSGTEQARLWAVLCFLVRLIHAYPKLMACSMNAEAQYWLWFSLQLQKQDSGHLLPPKHRPSCTGGAPSQPRLGLVVSILTGSSSLIQQLLILMPQKYKLPVFVWSKELLSYPEAIVFSFEDCCFHCRRMADNFLFSFQQ